MSGKGPPGLEPIGVIAHYNLLEALDRSGPGELFRARDTMRGRTVIVRRFDAEFATAEARTTLEKSARALSQLSHPNIIRLFEVGDDAGRLYLVFEHLQGQSLRRELAGHVFRVRRAVQLAVQMTDAVAEAHAAGYLHSGLSPESVVITEKGHAKIPAHELACRYGFDTGSSPPRLHDYLSPEELSGQLPDEPSDIFSIGAMVYEMLTGRRAGIRGSALPSATNPRVPKALDAVVMKAVAPNPARRYPTASALVRDLRAVEKMLDAGGHGDDEDFAAASPPRTVGALVLAATVAVIAVAMAWWFTRG